MADDSLSACLAEIKAHPGKFYVYILSRPCGTPFYVGVGSKWRITNHEYEAIKRRARSHKAAIIRQLLAEGECVTYQIAGWFDTWAEGAATERRLIAQYGRSDIGTGVLANRTDGGEGVPNIKWEMTEARAAGMARLAEKMRGRKLSDEHKAKIGAAGKGRKYPPEDLEKRSAYLSGRQMPAEGRERMRRAALSRDPETRNLQGLQDWNAANRSVVAQQQKDRWADPAYRQRLEQSLSQADRDFAYRQDEKYRENLAAKAKARWADPAFKERVTAAIRASKAKK